MKLIALNFDARRGPPTATASMTTGINGRKPTASHRRAHRLPENGERTQQRAAQTLPLGASPSEPDRAFCAGWQGANVLDAIGAMRMPTEGGAEIPSTMSSRRNLILLLGVVVFALVGVARSVPAADRVAAVASFVGISIGTYLTSRVLRVRRGQGWW